MRIRPLLSMCRIKAIPINPSGPKPLSLKGDLPVIEFFFSSLVYLGSLLMVYNIVGFVRFARRIRSLKNWGGKNRILYIPIVLLVLFLIGYLTVGFFGEADLVIAGILFGGSVFVFVMYRMLDSITDRILENEKMEAQLIAVEEVSRAKSAFLASMSHEMRTPMNMILGLDTLALKNPDLPDETRDQLVKIGVSARHLAELIENILIFQQKEDGADAKKEERFSLKETLDEICTQVSYLCEQKGLDFQFSFSKCANRDYAGDKTALKRALMCILDNAVKFTDAPGTVRFCVMYEQERGAYTCVRFVIADTGIGIDDEFLSKIFQPLTQEDQSFTNRFGGSGMGLSAANSIVKRMDGTIEVESRKGEGSTFTVRLPLLTVGGDVCASCDGGVPDQSEMCANCAGCRHVRDTLPLVSLAGKRILIVEDLDLNAEIVSDLLELEDAESERAENGLEAVNKVKASAPWHYDAILMDLRMPVMDGLEATRQIRALQREDTQNIPIIALTANAFQSDLDATRSAGMNAHLAKPADAEILYATLREWITISRKQKGGL